MLKVNRIMYRNFYAALLLLTVCCTTSFAENATKSLDNKPKKILPFDWVNPLSDVQAEKLNLPPTLLHATFQSPSMGIPVGYYIYLPPGYEKATEFYPVVYHLHGGRPGSENKSVRIANYVDAAIKKGTIKPTIYVFPNGGPISWYDMPEMQNGMGESVFIKELIPHIDVTYSTLSKREGRAIEGFSQGGRGTTRIMFKYPELFISAAPGGSGYGPEKTIQENDGRESEHLRFSPAGYNTWDLAKVYANRQSRPDLKILIWDGTKCFNFEFNQQYSAYLKELQIKHVFLEIPNVAHSATGCYELKGNDIMQHHQKSFDAHRSP